MPKYVDPEQRSREIMDAAMTILAEGGFARLTLRNLAESLGGSITLVTHFYPNRDALIAGLLQQLAEDVDAIASSIAAVTDPVERLRLTLEWAMPVTPSGLREERARIALVAHRNADAAVDAFIEGLEPLMRSVYRRAVEDLVPADEVEGTVDLLRSWVNGVALSTVEHPELWTWERQRRAQRRFLDLLGVTGGTARPSRSA